MVTSQSKRVAERFSFFSLKHFSIFSFGAIHNNFNTKIAIHPIKALFHSKFKRNFTLNKGPCSFEKFAIACRDTQKMRESPIYFVVMSVYSEEKTELRVGRVE